MSSKTGVPQDRKVLVNKPSTAVSRKLPRSSRTRLSTASEEPNQKENLQIVTKRELITLVAELENLKRENDFLIRQQEAKFGVTVDNAGHLKDELNKAKADNHSLLEEIQLGKHRCDRLHGDFIELQEKFESCERQLKQYRKQKKGWEDTKERLRVADDRCRRLLVKNKRLKTLLLKNNINPGIAVTGEVKEIEKTKTPSVSFSNNVRKVHDIRQQKPKTIKWV